MVISGIKALTMSLGLITSFRVAEAADGDDVCASQLVMLLASLPNPVAAASGQEVPPPALEASGIGPASGAGQIPSAVTLPNAMVPAAAQGLPTAAPVPARQSASPGQVPTRPPEKPALTRATGDVRNPEIQFDRAGLITMHTSELDVRQLLELISRRSGMNILVSPKVRGTITANFEKVTIQELLRSILKFGDLVEKVEGGIHFIYSKVELKDRAEIARNEGIHQSGLPDRSRLPILGHLFGTREKTDERGEPVMPLTTHILSPGDKQPLSQPQPGCGVQVDPLVTQAALAGSPSFQSRRPAVPDEARPAARHHVVHPGEDFPSIARDYYGSARLAGALWWVNRTTVAWPGALVAGVKIVIPPIEQIEGGSAGSRISRAAKIDPQVQQASKRESAEKLVDGWAATHLVPDPHQKHPATDSLPPQCGYAVHVVQPLETLRGIAHDRLGDPRRFQEIVELNQDMLADGRISQGMRLLLPQGARPASLHGN